MNPFDEFPETEFESVDGRWTTPTHKDFRQWQDKWEPIILDAMRKAETLDLFYELGESARTMVEESVREYLEEREG